MFPLSGVCRHVLQLLIILSVLAPVGAQEVVADHKADNAVFQEKIEERLLSAEQRTQEQAELNLGRLETAEERIEGVDRHLSQVLLIFGLSALIIFFLMMSSLRAQQRLSAEQVSRTVQGAERLMNDIRRELSRPEMGHLRIGHMLRGMMRRLRDGKDDISAKELAMVRTVCEDEYLSVNLYFMARILIAECEQRWLDAVQMLDELRLMASDDIDVLLHLSHVHGNLAEMITDAQESKRHQVKARQYYAHFAMMVQSERRSSPTQAVKKSPVPAPSLEKPLSPPENLVLSPENLVLSPENLVLSPENLVLSPENLVPSLEETVSLSEKTDSPSVKPISPPERPMLSPKKSVSPPERPVPSLEETVSLSEKADSPLESVAKPLNQQTTPPPKQPLKSSIVLPSLKIFMPKKGQLVKLAGGVSKKISNGASSSVAGLGAMLHMLRRDENITLPLVPSPPVSKIPTNVTGSEILMWQDIRKGDICMTRATNARTMRERNRLIDAAIVHYAQAQSYETNETLYQNWGQALLAKALHLPEKKRPPMFNAAVDKFMAGNVVKKHFFDFSLASLYAIMNNAEECKKWLDISLASNTLDRDTLRHAPDFDGVRSDAWFSEFLRE